MTAGGDQTVGNRHHVAIVYGWPSINSQFGIVDVCGFPKDYFYYYKTWWRNEPMLHLFPHWNWTGREGDEITVWVYSNLDEVELLVNGKSLGSQQVPRLGHVEWKTRYEPGAIEARGSKGGKVVVTEKRETTGPAASIRLTDDRLEIEANGEDVAVVKVEALDKEGRLVPIGKNKIAFTISGPGKVIGEGNGDPNCLESDKASRLAFQWTCPGHLSREPGGRARFTSRHRRTDGKVKT